MSDHVEARAKVVEDFFSMVLADSERRELLALLWDWTAEDWERGVMYGGGVGTIKPERGVNPYRTPPLPTKPSVIRAQVFDTERVLYGPITSSMDWCRAEDGFAVSPEDIRSFEVLWTEGA